VPIYRKRIRGIQWRGLVSIHHVWCWTVQSLSFKNHLCITFAAIQRLTGQARIMESIKVARRVTEYGLTSHSTHNRSFRWRTARRPRNWDPREKYDRFPCQFTENLSVSKTRTKTFRAEFRDRYKLSTRHWVCRRNSWLNFRENCKRSKNDYCRNCSLFDNPQYKQRQCEISRRSLCSLAAGTALAQAVRFSSDIQA